MTNLTITAVVGGGGLLLNSPFLSTIAEVGDK